MTGGPRSRAARWLRNGLFALLPLLVLLALAEGLLWAFGLGSPAERLSISRGFDPRASYILPDEQVPGGWRTQMNDGEEDEVHVPPKGSRVRVLLVGESNVEMLPEEYLQDELNRAALDPGFEVLNLGRRGYGSERIRILLQQALVLEPDVVVIYMGHNEFTEGGFKLELREIGATWLSGLGMHLRTVNVLTDLVRKLEGSAPGSGTKPEARRDRGTDFADISPETTRLFYDAFGGNLRSMCRMALDAGAQVLLSTVVTNTLVIPSVERRRPELTADEVRHCDELRAQCLAALPVRLVNGLSPRAPGEDCIHLHFEDWRELNPPIKGWKGPRAPALRPLSGELSGAPLWPDPSRWQPQVWVLMPTMSQFHARTISPKERVSLQRAAEAAEAELTLDPENARVLFELGLALYLLGGDDARAVALLDQAAAADAAPSHANDVTNGIVRETAAAFPDIAFLDAERRFRSCCPDGLASYEILMDNCHLQPGARKVLLRDFVPLIVQLAGR